MLTKLPSPFWAVLLAFMGVVVVLAVLFHHADDTISLSVLTVASNLVSGALGAFAGHGLATSAKTDVTSGSGSVTINPQDPPA